MCLLVAAFSAERLLFEALFPQYTQLGTPQTAIPLSITLTVILFVIVQRQLRQTALLQMMVAFAPLLANLTWLVDPTVDLVRSRFIFWTTIWLTVFLLLWQTQHATRWRWWGFMLVAYITPIYSATVGRTVGMADTFEFQVTAPQMGIAHPTGYPLYLMLGKLWTMLPFGRTIAMRLNIGTMVYAIIALLIIATLLHKLFNLKAASVLLTIPLAFLPTFWSQAIQAEVYSLHAIFVAAILLATLRLLRLENTTQQEQAVVWLALLLGFGMTNHVTTVLLVPAIGIALLHIRFWRWQPVTFVKMVIAGIAPLVLYLYLPIRWQVVNGEPMGASRLFEWVTGTRFAGALVWRAWLDDPTRWGIIGRIYLQEWGTIGLIIVALGFIALLIHNRAFALVLLTAWAAFSFYALNYYVPDLNVFMLPAQIIMGVCWAALPATIQNAVRRQTTDDRRQIAFPSSVVAADTLIVAKAQPLASVVLILILLAPPITRAIATYQQVDASQPNDLLAWAHATLSQPLAENAAILADSDKFPTLYYLQQAEGIRPDLDIMVLPDEAAYRNEINSRYGQQTIYLARYLPNLPYPMRSAGSLVELLPEREITDLVEPIAQFDGINLISADLQPHLVDNQTGVTLEWQVVEPSGAQQLYFRWRSVLFADKAMAGVNPVNAYYPTAAWQPGERVVDFHLLEPPRLLVELPMTLEVALAPPFTRAGQLDWVSLGRISAETTTHPDLTPLRIWSDSTLFSDSIFSGAALPASARPATESAAWVHGTRPSAAALTLQSADGEQFGQAGGIPEHESMSSGRSDVPYSWLNRLFVPDQTGPLDALLIGSEPLRCGWLSPLRDACPIGTLDVRGVPLPAGATNYADQLALLNIEVNSAELVPAGIFDVTLNWQSLAPLPEDYTVFVQLLDQNDQIVGQVDSWPLQGTYPTSQWQTGETISDPYKVQLQPDLAAGDYRLIVGLYNLRDLQRLPVLDANGNPIDDKSIIPNLYVP